MRSETSSEAKGDVVSLRGDRNRLSHLATLATHLAVLLLALGISISVGWGWREDVSLDQGEMAQVRAEESARGREPLYVRAQGARVTRYADGRAAGYDLEVTVREGEGPWTQGHIRLNDPFIYRGVAFYLQAYARQGSGYRVTVRAVDDPGYVLVVTSGLLLFVGLTVTFHFPPASVLVRTDSGGTLRLSGRATRRAWGFGREFDQLAAEIREATGETTNLRADETC